MFGLKEAEVAALVRAVAGDDLDRASIEERFARATWTGIAEPGDRMAGLVIAAMGASRSLTAVVERWGVNEFLAELSGGVGESELQQAIDRWQPRLSSGNALIALRQAARFGARLRVPSDEGWPESMADLQLHAPLALWTRGTEDAYRSLGRSMALVGARAATGYGEHVTMEASAGLVDRGYSIVSGAAYGIDGMAHRAALASHGQTIAFLAGGVDRFYPSGHDALLTRIVESGVVISELPCGSSPTKWSYVNRTTSDWRPLPLSLASGQVAPSSHAPYWHVLDADGTQVLPCEAFLTDFWARGMSAASLESYARDLLRWFRFLWLIGVDWRAAGRDHVREFVVWMRSAELSAPLRAERPSRASRAYAPTTINHNLAVLSGFYEFHLRSIDGPILNPVPIRVGRGGQRFAAHHNPLDPFPPGHRADFRQRVPNRAPRAIPDQEFNRLFDVLDCDRDRALVAFWVSSAARPSELVGMTNENVNPGEQTISVIRKGTGELQRIPASPDAFLWFRLYQESLPLPLRAPRKPAWWTRRRPLRPLNYEAARGIIRRLNPRLGTAWTLHDFRHTAAIRMSDDPALSLPDIQRVLGHASLTTTQTYLRSHQGDVLARVNEHLRNRENPRDETRSDGQAVQHRYDAEDLRVLFGDAN